MLRNKTNTLIQTYIPCKKLKGIKLSNELIFQHSTKWTLDNNCSNCICINGYVKCKKTDCPWKGKCPEGRRFKNLNRSCCHQCELSKYMHGYYKQ